MKDKKEKRLLVTNLTYLFISLLITLTSCNKSPTSLSNEEQSSLVNTHLSNEEKKEEDCDKDKAKEELEKIKKEEFSLSKNSNDPGCTLEKENK